MKPCIFMRNAVRNRPGFTLLELLTVIVIIGMLSSMTLVVVTVTQREARVSATQGLIDRLDEVVTEMYEEYDGDGTMSFPVDATDVGDLAWSFSQTADQTAQKRDQISLHYRLDTMRMAMPCNWYEALSPAQPFTDPSGNLTVDANSIPLATGGRQLLFEADRPALHQVYTAAFVQAVLKLDRTVTVNYLDSPANTVVDLTNTAPAFLNVLNDHNASAKLLYLMIMNGVPETRGMFHERYIAQPDGDGLNVFVDSWGNPIQFLRWAPAFPGSERQPDIWKWTAQDKLLTQSVVLTDTATVDGRRLEGPAAYWCNYISPDGADVYATHAAYSTPYFIEMTRQRYPDPLDTMDVRRYVAGSSDAAYPGWALIPMVYSAGPDKYLGTGDDVGGIYNPVSGVCTDPFRYGLGAPVGAKGYYLDNIHNHRLGGQ